jgi:hypothetical protein
VPQRYWNFILFRQGSAGKRIDELLVLLSKSAAECTSEELDLKARILAGARYDESSWLNVLRPINDEMRSLQPLLERCFARDRARFRRIDQLMTHQRFADIDAKPGGLS